MNSFWDLHQTHGRTHEHELIGPNRSTGDQKLWRFIAAFGRYRPKTLKNGYFGQNGQILTILGVKNLFDQKNSCYLSHMETQLNAKSQKKYWTVKAVGPERTYERTNKRTNVREWIYRFLPKSKDIRGTNKQDMAMEHQDICREWPKTVKIWPFLAKIAIFECFWSISSKRHYELS